MRLERGCDGNAPIPVFEMDCVRCGGTNPDCKICGGAGIEKFYRCPVKLITPDTVNFIRYYNFYKNGYLPVQGGMLDQAFIFTQAIKVFDDEIKSLQIKD